MTRAIEQQDCASCGRIAGNRASGYASRFRPTPRRVPRPSRPRPQSRKSARHAFRTSRVIIQPQAVALINGSWTVNQTIANQLCFRYEYDGRARTAIRKAPGAGQVWKVYDARDRAVMSQDSLLRSQHKWMYAKYDAEDRLDSTSSHQRSDLLR